MIRTESLYIYFEKYYFSNKKEEKDNIFKEFVDIFWKSTPNFKKYETSTGWKCKLMNRDDDAQLFLKDYINYLYGKYCCRETWINHDKFDYDYKRFRVVIDYYLKRIFDNYLPIDVYEEKMGKNILSGNHDLFGDDGHVVKYVTNSLRGYFYNRIKKHLSGKYIECVCGAQSLRTSNRQVMCKDCSKKKELERQRIKWNKYKNKYRNAT